MRSRGVLAAILLASFTVRCFAAKDCGATDLGDLRMFVAPYGGHMDKDPSSVAKAIEELSWYSFLPPDFLHFLGNSSNHAVLHAAEEYFPRFSCSVPTVLVIPKRKSRSQGRKLLQCIWGYWCVHPGVPTAKYGRRKLSSSEAPPPNIEQNAPNVKCPILRRILGVKVCERTNDATRAVVEEVAKRAPQLAFILCMRECCFEFSIIGAKNKPFMMTGKNLCPYMFQEIPIAREENKFFANNMDNLM